MADEVMFMSAQTGCGVGAYFQGCTLWWPTQDAVLASQPPETSKAIERTFDK
jgi:hypothetical protein